MIGKKKRARGWVAVIVGCLVVAAQAEGLPRDLDAWARAARSRVVSGMKDPGSVRFRALFVSSWRDGNKTVPVLCGEVNAKNGYGGYVGFHRFVADDDGVVTDLSAEGWSDFCSHPVKQIR